MKKISYEQEVKNHLSKYKKNRLQVKEKGIWRKNGKEYFCSHILPKHLKGLNIIETIRTEFWEYVKRENLLKDLDKNFHHLNSSQAMCFNLFFPLLKSKEIYGNLLLELLEIPQNNDIFIESFQFEKVVDKNENTHFDLFLQLNTRVNIYIETKYKERFGSAKKDKNHIIKYKKLYNKRMVGKIQDSYREWKNFYKNYQIIRNLIYLDSNSYVIFIYPKKNDIMVNKERLILNSIVDPIYKSQVKIIFLETLCEKLLNKTLQVSPKLYTHYLLFREKYLLL